MFPRPLRDLGENTQTFSMAPPLAVSYAQFILIPKNSLANRHPLSLLFFVRILMCQDLMHNLF